MSSIALLKYLGSTVLLFVAFALCILSDSPGVQGSPLNARPPRCKIVCLAVYAPLCGTDGKTYGNECHLNVENNCDETSPGRIRKAYEGECKGDAQYYPDRATCIEEVLSHCISIQVLICGTDGIIYGNPCDLESKNKCDGTVVKEAPFSNCKGEINV